MPDQREDLDRPTFFMKLRKILLLGMLSLIGMSALLEIGLRVYYAARPTVRSSGPAKPAQPDYSYELVSPDGEQRISRTEGWIKLAYHPYMVYKNLPNQHTELYHINSLGLRGEEVTAAKREDVFRIIMTGNSATFGVGASNDQGTLPFLLQRALNNRGAFAKRVEVLNAGVIGYLTVQELAYLQMELVDLNPDLIIAYNGYDDFIAAASQSRGCTQPVENPGQMSYHHLFYEVERTLIEHVNEKHQSVSARTMALGTSLILRTYAGRFLHEKLWGQASPSGLSFQQSDPAHPSPSVGAADGDVIPDCVQAVVDNYRWHLSWIAELSVDWGAKLVLVVQPESSWKSQRSPEENRARQEIATAKPWYEKAAAAIYPSFSEAARRVAADYHVGFLDLSHVFDAHQERVFLDLVHLNDAGNQIVAQALADHLLHGGANVQP